MENFIDRIITGQEFSDSFYILKRKTLEAYDALKLKINSKKLKDFQPDSKSKGFVSCR
jgi:hypothetical protein